MTTLKDVMAIIVASYPNQPFPEATVKVYKKLLKDLDPEILMSAAQHYITTNTSGFPPNIGQLRATVAELQAKASGAPEPMEAFGMAIQAIRDHGIDRRMGKHASDHVHPVIDQAVKAMGGWMTFGMNTNQDALRAHFSQAYSQLAAREKKEIIMLPEIRKKIEGLTKKLQIKEPENVLSK